MPQVAGTPWQFATALTIARANPVPDYAVPSRRQVADLKLVE
ncbi:MAG: hypothetical protein H6R12_2034 [Proteobacteria bacterium]|nr:hypothetical protein [Pseudomonadota bacterium]